MDRRFCSGSFANQMHVHFSTPLRLLTADSHQVTMPKSGYDSTGWAARFQPHRSAPMSVDDVWILSTMDHQMPQHPAVNGGLRREEGFQPPRVPPATYGGARWDAGFHAYESAPISVDDVWVLDTMNQQITQHPTTVYSGAVPQPPIGAIGSSPPLALDHELNHIRRVSVRITEAARAVGILSEEAIEMNMKTRAWDDRAKEDDICIVCQDGLVQENETIGILSCGHEFHASCIKMWLLRKNTCPLCKAVGLNI